MPAVSLVGDFSRDASAFYRPEAFCPSQLRQLHRVAPNYFPREDFKVAVGEDQMLRLGNSPCPQSDEIFSNVRQSLLAAWTPFEVAAVVEALDGSAIFARAINFFVSAAAEIVELPGVKSSAQLGSNCLVEIVVVVEE